MKERREVTLKNREAVRRNMDYSWLDGGKDGFFLPGCYHEVWKTLINGGFDFGNEIIGINRKGVCYFWEYVPNMSFETGNDLRNKEAEKQNMSYDRKLVIISLIIAGSSLIASAVSLYFSLRK